MSDQTLLKNIAALFIVTLLTTCGGGSGSGDGEKGAIPTVPSGISATEGVYSEKVEITWADSDNAEYYIIYKSIDDRDKFKVIASRITEPSYTDEKVTPNRIYFYKVAAGNGEKWSDPSTDARGFAHSGKPLSPDDIIASSDRIAEIFITWSATPQTDSYKILRCETENGDYSEIVSGVTETSYTDRDSSLIRDKKYYYRIIAVNNEEGESEPCEAVYGIALQDIPLSPGNVTATNGTYGNKVDVTWDSTEHAVTYIVYRAKDSDGDAMTSDPGQYTRIASNITALLFEDVTAGNDILYRYCVSAVSSGGESQKGGSAAGKKTTGAPIQTAAPINVSASDGNRDSITITWEPAEGASAYSVYRCDTINGTYELAPDGDKLLTTSFIDTPPQLIQNYFYSVTSWSTGESSVESRMSIADSGYAMPRIAEVPSGLSATTNRTDGTINLTWNTSLRADSYKIYRSESSDGTFNLIASGITELTYIDEYPSISVGRSYFYKIAAVNATGDSESSSAAAGNTVMKVPAGVTISKTARYVREIKWDLVREATAYEVDHLIYGSFKKTVTVTSNSCTFSELQNSVQHEFRVRAVNEFTKSANSSQVKSFVVWLE